MQNPRWLDAQEQAVWRSVLELSSRIVDGVDHDVAVFGLTGADYEVLVHLSEAEGHGLRMSQLASRVLISRSRLTYRVDRLEERSLVVRESCVTDRRGFVARLTPAGMDLLVEAAPTHAAGVCSRLVDRLDRAELLELGRISAKLLGDGAATASTGSAVA